MDTRDVTRKINEQFNGLFTIKTEDDGRKVTKPNICGVCDEYIHRNDKQCISMKLLKETHYLISKQESVEYHEGCDDYYFDGDIYDDSIPWCNLLLSPDTQVIQYNDTNDGCGILSCGTCKESMKNHRMPINAIANGFFFGNPPECLTCLTEIERAFLSPVKTYGFCFSYTGGFQKELKGSLSYYKVNVSSIVRTVAHFETLGMTDNIVILLYGKMTRDQKQRALKKNQMRTEQMLRAVDWLCTYNAEWKKAGVDIQTVARRLKNPQIIDNSQIEEQESNSNIEKSESIQIFFPDTSIDISTGGQETVQEFKSLVQEAKKHGYDFELQADLLREAVSDYKDNNLVNSCIVQYPYGRGGLQEERLLNNEKTGLMDIESYVKHVSRISRPHFNEELFVLILYNMKMKMKMVKGAGWRVRQATTATLLATELTEEDIDTAVNNRQSGTLGEGTGDQFLKAVDAVGRGVAHTNEAAKKARRTAESMQHSFGMPTHFLTVTPDDDNSILVQIYSQIDIDINSIPTDEMSTGEIENNARMRKSLRIKYPGITAMAFEDQLSIIIETVIGWDIKTGAVKMGLFGTPLAFTCTVEEQGRRTLHAHFQIWIQEIYEERKKIFSSHRETSRAATQILQNEADRTMGNTFFFNKRDVSPRHAKIFPHDCSVSPTRRKELEIVCDQTLRELRYKEGNAYTGHMFAKCPHCPKSWTYEELVKDYLLYNVKDAGCVACEGDGNFATRMKAKTVEYQIRPEQDSIPSYVIETAYNLHSHTTSCFKRTWDTKKTSTTNRQRKNEKRKMLECECRYRLPARKKKKTEVGNACEDKIKWYDWKGNYSERNVKELNIKRGRYDLFQNQSCPSIGESKLSCNTNINMIFHGSTGQYAFKYCTKPTQEDERAEFDRVMEQKDKILSKLRQANTDRSEATRRVLVASFAHQRSNVIGAPMSSYLTRNEERFIFSHPTVWIPVRDLRALLDKKCATSATISYHGNTPFFQCLALHYLARPAELEEVCVFDFYADYEVIHSTRRLSESLFKMHNTEHFVHPSYRERTGKYLQGVRERHQRHLPKVFQWDFPDTAEFCGNILESDTINRAMEIYAELALVLFLPFRSKNDIMENGSYVLKLRTVKDVVEERSYFLNNIQDAKSNCFRIMRLEDDLQRVTEPMTLEIDDEYQNWRDDEVEEESKYMQGEALDNFLDLLERELLEDNTDREGTQTPQTLNIKRIKDKGKRHCGYRELCHLDTPKDISQIQMMAQSPDDALDDDSNEDYTDDRDITGAEGDGISTEKQIIQKRDIVRIIVEHTGRITRTFKEITNCEDEVEVMEANGTVKSIVDWATKAHLDRQQRRAFEMILGHFLLTFCMEAVTNMGDPHGDRSTFNRHKADILKLLEKDRTSSPQTICLLYGPGGCGKTTVIDLVLEYAREYCSYLEQVHFDARTITVTALTGVAATILRGETTHGAAYLNQTRPLEPHQIEMWENTRMLIVDEVSFAGKEMFIELDKKLRKLKSRPDVAYGGLSVIFSGDFRQLEPVGTRQEPMYRQGAGCPQFNNWINCYLELAGMHRFKDDPAWGLLLRRFREGNATLHDIETINTRVVSPTEDLPNNIRYATYFNRDRDAINAGLFEQRCEDLLQANLPLDDSIIILCDKQSIKNGSNVYTRFKNPKKLWEECGEDDIKPAKMSNRMDPALRLYIGCRVMLPSNEDVRNGLANGTQARVVKVHLHRGVHLNKTMINSRCGVNTVLASQVESIELEHVSDRISPRIFHIKPKQHSFKVKLEKPHLLQTKKDKTEEVRMKANQIPLMVCNATTGHKLQGCGVPSIFVNSWSDVPNWTYVVLSRVRTLSGLYLREPLRSDLTRFAMPEDLRTMIQGFKDHFSPTLWTEEQYRRKFDL